MISKTLVVVIVSVLLTAEAAVLNVGYATDQRTYPLRETPEVSDFHFIDGATVSIEYGYAPGFDKLYLDYSGAFPLRARFDEDVGVLFITGLATTSEYAVAIRGVQFLTSSRDGDPRQITWAFGRNTFYFSSTRHYYTLFDTTTSWSNARTTCQMSMYMGVAGYLATIATREERDQLGIKVNGPYWLGATADASRRWSWVDGPEAGTAFWQGNSVYNGGTVLPSLTFFPWNHFEPDVSGSFLYLNNSAGPSTGSWGAATASAPYVSGFVCEYGGQPTATVTKEDELQTYFGTAIVRFDCSRFTVSSECNRQRDNGCAWSLRNQRFSCNQLRCHAHFDEPACTLDPRCSWNTERPVAVCVHHRCGALSNDATCTADPTCTLMVNETTSQAQCLDTLCHQMTTSCDCAKLRRCAWRHNRCGREVAMNCTAMDILYLIDDTERMHGLYGTHTDGFIGIVDTIQHSEPFLTNTPFGQVMSNLTFGQRVGSVTYGSAPPPRTWSSRLTGVFSEFRDDMAALRIASSPGTQRNISAAIAAAGALFNNTVNASDRRMVLVVFAAGAIADAATADVSLLNSLGVIVFGVAMTPTDYTTAAARAALASLSTLTSRVNGSPSPIAFRVDDIQELVIDHMCRSMPWNYDTIRASRSNPSALDTFGLKPELCSVNFTRASCVTNPMCVWDYSTSTCNNTRCLAHCTKTNCRADDLCVNATFPEAPVVCVELCPTLNSSQCGRYWHEWGTGRCSWNAATGSCQTVTCISNPSETSCNADPQGCWWSGRQLNYPYQCHSGSPGYGWGGAYCGPLGEIDCSMNIFCEWNADVAPGYCVEKPCAYYNENIGTSQSRCLADSRCVWQTAAQNKFKDICLLDSCATKYTSCTCFSTKGCIWKNDECFEAKYSQCPQIDVAFAIETTPATMQRYGRYRRLFLGVTQAIRDWSTNVPISAGADLNGYRFQMVGYGKTAASGGALHVPNWWGSGGNFTNTRDQWLGFGKDLDWISFNGSSYANGVTTVALKPALDKLIQSFKESEKHPNRIRTLFIVGISPITDGDELESSLAELKALGVKIFVNAVRNQAEPNLKQLRAVEFLKPLASHPTELYFMHNTVSEWQTRLDEICQPLSSLGTLLNVTLDGELPCNWLDSELKCNLQPSCVWNPTATATCANADGCPNLECLVIPPSLAQTYTCANCRLVGGEWDCSRSYNFSLPSGTCQISPCSTYCSQSPCEATGPDRPTCEWDNRNTICQRKTCQYADMVSCNADPGCIYSEIDYTCHRSVCGSFRSRESCNSYEWRQGNGTSYLPCRWIVEGVSRPYCEEMRCTLLQQGSCEANQRSPNATCEWLPEKIGYKCQNRACAYFDRVTCLLDDTCFWDPFARRCRVAGNDCILSGYSLWSQCSAGCGTSAVTTKVRSVLSFPRNGGLSCSAIASRGCTQPNTTAVQYCDTTVNETTLTVVRNCQSPQQWVPPFPGRAGGGWPSDCTTFCRGISTREVCERTNDCYWRSGRCDPSPDLGCAMLSPAACAASDTCKFDEAVAACKAAVDECQFLNQTACAANAGVCRWYPSGLATKAFAEANGVPDFVVQLFNPGQETIRPFHDLTLVASMSSTVVEGVTVVIEGNYQRGKDVLSFAFSETLSSTWSEYSGVLSITGRSTLGLYIEALQSVTFTTTSTTTKPRRITWSLGDSFIFSSATRHHYKAYNEPMTLYDGAEAACRQQTLFGRTGYLATVTSQAENDFIASKLFRSGWISGKYTASEVWQYTTGSVSGETFWQGGLPSNGGVAVPSMYTNWKADEPFVTGPDMDALFINSFGEWESKSLNDINIDGYVCEFGGLPTDTPPTFALGGVNVIGIGGCVADSCAWHKTEALCWLDVECTWRSNQCEPGCHSFSTQGECQAASMCSWSTSSYPPECRDAFTLPPTPQPTPAPQPTATTAAPSTQPIASPPMTTSASPPSSTTVAPSAPPTTLSPGSTPDTTTTGGGGEVTTSSPGPMTTAPAATTAAPPATSTPTNAPRGNCDVNVTEPSGAISSVTAINEILLQHNLIRLSVLPTAVTMPLLRWSKDLSTGAAAYIDQCPGLVHSATPLRQNTLGWRYVGENIAAGISNASRFSWNSVVPMWGREGDFFQYISTCATGKVCGNCTPAGMYTSCGHYTQIVWANTTEVGCAYKYCPSDPARAYHYYICWYGSGGNLQNFAPYTAGAPSPDQCTIGDLLRPATPAPPTGAPTASSPQPVPSDATTHSPLGPSPSPGHSTVGPSDQPDPSSGNATAVVVTSPQPTSGLTPSDAPPTDSPLLTTAPQGGNTTASAVATTAAPSATSATSASNGTSMPPLVTATTVTATGTTTPVPPPPTTPSPTTTSAPAVVSGTITLGGTNFDQMLASDRAALEEATRNDIARLLNVSNTSVQVTLSVGTGTSSGASAAPGDTSLRVGFTVTVPTPSDASKVTQRVATIDNNNASAAAEFQQTLQVYTEAGGNATDFRILGASVDDSTPPPTAAPDDGGSNLGLIIGASVGALLFVGLIVGAGLLYRRRAANAPTREQAQEQLKQIYALEQELIDAPGLEMLEREMLGASSGAGSVWAPIPTSDL